MSSSAVCGCAVERATGRASVRISGCIQHKPVRARGGAVSEATAVTESVVVEVLRMFNSLCETMGEPSRRTWGKIKRKGSQKALRLSKPPIRKQKTGKMRPYQNETGPRQHQFNEDRVTLYSQKGSGVYVGRYW